MDFRSVGMLVGVVLGCLAAGCSAGDDPVGEDTGELTAAAQGRPDTCTDPTMPDTALPCARSEGVVKQAIAPGLVDNGRFFDSEFFHRFTPRTEAAPFALTDAISKRYAFPTLYTDVTSAVALFLCSLDRARELLPDPSMKPVEMGFGRGLVVISSTRFNRIQGMEGYNEVVISIPVVVDRTFNPPVLPLLKGDWRGLGFYVISVPVTTEENRLRGRFWGLPKVLQEIDLAVEGDQYVTRVKDDSSNVYLEYRVPMRGDETDVDSTNYVYSNVRGALVRSEQHQHGHYVKTTWASALAGLHPSPSSLKLGSSPAAAMLRDLDIDPHPFQVRFGKDTDSALDLPVKEFRTE